MRTCFFLYFNEEAPARDASSVLDRRGFDVRVQSPDEHLREWAVLALKDMSGRVTSLGFGLTERRLSRLASRLGGEYDGHEVEIPR